MTNNLGSTRGVAWFEGMQLFPQHLQIADASNRAVSARFSAFSSEPNWGYQHIALDTSLLRQGTLHLDEASGVFPDLTPFEHISKRDGALTLSLDSMAVGSEAVFALTLPVSDFTEGGTTVRRFRQALSSPVQDIFDPSERIAVPLMVPQLSVQRIDQNGNYLYLPFVKISRTSGGFEQLGYQAPVARLDAGAPCARSLQTLLASARIKAEALQGVFSTRAIGPVQEAETSARIAAIWRHVLPLECAMDEGSIAPRDLYLRLLAFSGDLAAASRSAPPVPCRYRHEDIEGTLAPLRQYIDRTLDSLRVPAARTASHRLDEVGLGAWLGAIPAGVENELVLRIEFSHHYEDASVLRWLNAATICFEADMSMCRTRRVRGFVRERIANDRYVQTDRVRHIIVQLPDVRASDKIMVSAPDVNQGLGVASIECLHTGVMQ